MKFGGKQTIDQHAIVVADALREVKIARDALAVKVSESGAKNRDVVVALEVK